MRESRSCRGKLIGTHALIQLSSKSSSTVRMSTASISTRTIMTSNLPGTSKNSTLWPLTCSARSSKWSEKPGRQSTAHRGTHHTTPRKVGLRVSHSAATTKILATWRKRGAMGQNHSVKTLVFSNTLTPLRTIVWFHKTSNSQKRSNQLSRTIHRCPGKLPTYLRKKFLLNGSLSSQASLRVILPGKSNRLYSKRTMSSKAILFLKFRNITPNLQ